ncbi:aminoglycoside 6-adenylyltransferase [Virgibacillus sp. MG-45]|uniref:aminoglycoside 6-adenylyltransferase n=1 Tax=Virgibacillus sp. MG-45 TaxID=3102791 RepID=UPI002ED8B8E0
MRTEQEMMGLLIRIAKDDDRIRAVYMNGSRTNPNVPKDIFQDYDIVYVVTETRSFIQDQAWIHAFGELLMLQEPDKNDAALHKNDNNNLSTYGYLMLFTDGNRIDLHIETEDHMLRNYGNDMLTVPLVDKDNILPDIPAPTDQDYFVQRPTEAMYSSCCNDFWWCLQNVAKGIWRDELPYAKQMFECVVRHRLDEMVSWWVGSNYNFEISVGKMGKYFKTYLPTEYWSMYEKTYAGFEYNDMWEAIFISCEFFRTLAQDLSDQLSFRYPEKDDSNMMKYLQTVRRLPSDATEIM